MLPLSNVLTSAPFLHQECLQAENGADTVLLKHRGSQGGSFCLVYLMHPLLEVHQDLPAFYTGQSLAQTMVVRGLWWALSLASKAEKVENFNT